ncbi:MAG: amidohydrolase [Candidatus Glassbacteria bacterium]|nr:amidohydrolase [Candidatus Glassbacteria bacterium]
MCTARKFLFVLLAVFMLPALSSAQTGDLRLLDWRPQSMMVVKETEVLKPKYPVIDVHNHLGRLANMQHYLEQMDEAGVWKVVSLDGRSAGDFYKKHLEAVKKVSPERLLVFFRPDFDRIDEPGWGQKEAARLEQAVKMGCRGLKIAKNLGLTHKDSTGALIKVDDRRIDPIWAKCSELGIPVMIHVSDPKAFFTPLDERNERYDELGAHPRWSFYGDQFPSKEEILAARNRVFARHPNTIFIGAHFGNLPEEIHQVANWLDLYPNFYVDIDARISELGRQPRTARKFFLRYQDRVMFGTDTPPNAEAYRIYYRFLETDDEYFDPTGGHHLQGRWMIYGVYLPDDVLEKIYNKNALKVFGMFKGA